jgi:hypothetical protein
VSGVEPVVTHRPLRIPVAAALALAAAITAGDEARAVELFDPSELAPGHATVDFEDQSAGPLGGTSVTIQGVRFESSADLTIFDISPYYAGDAIASHLTLSPQKQPMVPIEIHFPLPVQEVGLGWWDANLEGNVLEAYDAGGAPLESVTAATGPTGGAFADFVGIRRATAEIASVRWCRAPRTISMRSTTWRSSPRQSITSSATRRRRPRGPSASSPARWISTTTSTGPGAPRC